MASGSANEAASATTGIGLSLEQRHALALAVLERPDRRNAISAAMRTAMAGWYPKLGRDPAIYAVVIRSALPGVFSVGGDIREMLELAAADLASAHAALAAELALCWQHECFSKPTISLIDGPVMGTGVGITLFGTHRVAGEGYRFRMPETAIGYFPDCGVAHAFARMPGAIGLYLGLTGADALPADALALGLATHCIPAAEFEAIERLLADADPVDPVLDDRHRDPGPSPLLAARERIDRYFDAPDMSDICARLARPRAEDSDWAVGTLAHLRRLSPLALCLTFRAIRAAARLDIRETLQQDFRLASRLVAGPEMREGVRAALVDKDRAPLWQHARVEDVPAEIVDAHFAPLGANELALPTRAELQGTPARL